MARNIIVLGSANMDLVVPVERLPRRGETISGGDVAFFPGGKGANQACAAGRLGTNVSMIAQVGNDGFGERLLASLEQAGVNTSRVGKANRPTGCAFITVLKDGENAIIVSPGANAALEPEIAVARMDIVNRDSFVLSQLEIPMETVVESLSLAKQRDATTILDPAPSCPLPVALMRVVDYLTPNESEAVALLDEPSAGIRDSADAKEVAQRLLALGPRAVILKLGRLGCYLAAEDVRTLVEGYEVAAVDTTAAGDVFNGAFAVALAEGKPLLDAARFANAAAAISVTRAGAQSSIPRREEVDLFLGQRTVSAV